MTRLTQFASRIGSAAADAGFTALGFGIMGAEAAGRLAARGFEKSADAFEAVIHLSGGIAEKVISRTRSVAQKAKAKAEDKIAAHREKQAQKKAKELEEKVKGILDDSWKLEMVGYMEDRKTFGVILSPTRIRKQEQMTTLVQVEQILIESGVEHVILIVYDAHIQLAAELLRSGWQQLAEKDSHRDCYVKRIK